MKSVNETKRIPLDNAGNCFPGTSSHEDTRVFRLTCELNEMVDQAELQRAAVETLEYFPLYRRVLCKGLFWYSMEESNQLPVVEEERTSPCRMIYDRRRQQLQFRITYYRCRINLEVYHALSDGAGAMSFFKLLICRYLTGKHIECLPALATMISEFSPERAMEDAFKKYHNGKTLFNAIKEKKLALQGLVWKDRGIKMSGPREPNNQIKLLAGGVSVKNIIEKAREQGTTVTVLLTAILISSIYESTPQRNSNRPVVVTVPVNLRNYFPSESARNFFVTINVGYHFSGNDTIKTISKSIEEQFARELTPERLFVRMNTMCSLAENSLLGLIPRCVKDGILKAANFAGSIGTTCVSNLGRITMPSELNQYIKLFDATTSTKGIQFTVCSYEDEMVINLASRLIDTRIPMCFFRTLSEQGIAVQVSARQYMGMEETQYNTLNSNLQRIVQAT